MATATFQSILPRMIPFPVARPIRNLLEKALGIGEVDSVYGALRAMGEEKPIAERLLEMMSVSCDTSQADLARIPSKGAAILTVNHPFGILEGAVLASLIRPIRTDFRFLANGILTAVPELGEMVIPVDPIGGRDAIAGNGTGLREALRHLLAGGLLVVFPAGEVSHFRWKERCVSDGEWNPIVARMVRMAARRGCPIQVAPAYVAGSNSTLFQTAGMVHPGLRTALLARELLNKRGQRVEVRVGAPVTAKKLLAMPTEREQMDYLRWRTYLLASRERYQPRTSLPLRRRGGATEAVAVAEPLPAEELAAEVAALPANRLLNRVGDLAVYLAKAAEIPSVLVEIGRLREITFRSASEGTGKPLDLDEFDAHYLHLFVWNTKQHELVGAYRLACTDVVRKEKGVRSLYTAALFGYREAFLDRLGPAVELGRSFVRQEYQKGFAPLLLLWKGIGSFIAANPRYRTLFGAVSISNRYETVSRELMVSFLEKYAMLNDWRRLLRNSDGPRTRILKGAHRPAFPQAGFDIDDLSSVVADIEQGETGVPVLLRQYLRLGGKLLGFHVDPHFSNTLDGLIVVDLSSTEPKLLERYLGKEEAILFLQSQKGIYGTQQDISDGQLGVTADCSRDSAPDAVLQIHGGK